MGLTCNTDAYGRTLQSQSEFNYVSNTNLSETERQLAAPYDCNAIASQEEN